jgi:hypothetical protein
VTVSWPIVLWAFGYSITAPWVVASTAPLLLFPVLGGLYWAMRGEAIDVAITRSDDAAAALLLTAPRSVAVSRIEDLALVIIIVLMVSRPD